MDWTAISAISAAIVAAGALIAFTTKHMRPRMLTRRQFIENMVGVPANPVSGQKRVPGLFERLDDINSRLATQDQALAQLGGRLTTQDQALAGLHQTLGGQNQTLGTIEHEVRFNNGSSVKDGVTRTEATLKEITQRLDAIEDRLKNKGPGQS